MLQLTKTALKRPVSTAMIVLALIVFGISSLLGTPVELIPNIEMPMLIVATVYPGAAPRDVESLVTSNIEKAVSTLGGIKNVQSSSAENFSMVILEMEYGTDMEKAHSELKNQLDIYANSLPEDASAPTVMELNINSMTPTIVLSATASGDIDLLQYIKEEVNPEFEKLSGVASVDVSGGASDYIRVQLREEKLSQYGLTMSTLVSLLKNADFSFPAGTIGQGNLDLALRGGVSYDTTESLRSIPITLKTGDVIHFSDVADIYEAAESKSSLSRYNGRENVGITVTKRQSASTLSVTRAVKKMAEQLNTSGQGLNLEVVYDSSTMIQNALDSLGQTLIYGTLLAMAILFLFFGDWRASMIVGTSIPLSLLVTLIAMSVMGFSYNMMSLGGLVIGVGMMVDNSIVVLESCFCSRFENNTPAEAALEGTRAVASSIFGSTLTTVVVFLPIALIQGMSGQLFGQLCFTIVFSLIASLISALTVVPLMYKWLQPREQEHRMVHSAMSRLEHGYIAFLPKTLAHKGLVVLTAVVLLIGSVALIPFLGVELLPETDDGSIALNVTARPGLKLDALDEMIRPLEEMVAAHPDVDRYSLSAGSAGLTTSMSGLMGGTAASATLTAYLKDDRALSTRALVDRWREETAGLLNCEVSVSAVSTTSMMAGGSDIQISLQGTDLDTLEQTALQAESLMRENPSILQVSSSLSSGKPQVEIVVDPVKASAVGLVPAAVMQNVYQIMEGSEAGTLHQNNRDYSVRVEYPSDRFAAVSDLAGMTISSPMGLEVPLLDIASIEYSSGPQSISRKNSRYLITLSGQPASDAPDSLAADLNAQIAGMEMPFGVELTQSAASEQMQEEFSTLLGAIATAVFLVFMVMAMQFESPRFSIVVMLCVPFALVGSFGLLLLTGGTLSLVSLMGFLMLVGIVVNNGILFIDTTDRLRAEEGVAPETALARAGALRMRPIFMTTLTTVLAMIPMAVNTKGNAALMNGMAMVIIGGLMASTVLALLLLPSFYMLVDRKEREKKQKKSKKEKTLPAART